jgi:signal transduction histidine kinase
MFTKSLYYASTPAAGAAGAAGATSGHGILGMRERARLLGGALRLVSAPGRGTTVTASAPLAGGGAAERAGAPTPSAAPRSPRRA